MERGDIFFKRRKKFPIVNVAKLGPIGFCKIGDEAKIVSFGETAASPTFSRKTIRTCLNPSQIDSKMLLAQKPKISLQRTINRPEKKDNAQERRKKQLREKGRISTDCQRANDEVQKLRNKIEQTQAKIDAFDEEHESESELQRLKLFKNLQYYFEQVKKELYEILKQQQQKGKSQKEVDKLGESIASKEKERNALKERPGREYSVGIARSLC